MNEDNNQPSVTPNAQPQMQDASTPAMPKTTGEPAVLPTVDTVATNQQQTPSAAPTFVQNPQINTPPTLENNNPVSAPNEIQYGVSASQMAINKPKRSLLAFITKRLLVKALVVLVVLLGIFTALVLTNIIVLSEFKSTSYSNSDGTDFKLDFYAKHSTKQLKGGNNQLVSKVSKDGKFPIAISITTDSGLRGYQSAKDCAASTKAFDVQNNALDQKISVCDISGTTGLDASDGVYIAGFTSGDKAHLITIAQDLGDIDLSSQSGAQESLEKFGMTPYRKDIERIVSSIMVE